MIQESARHVVITGASRGIGAALATNLADRGNVVYGCARSPAVDGCNYHLEAVDVTDRVAVESWASLVEKRSPKIDLLVNNAAEMGDRGEFNEVAPESWQQVVDTNVLGTVWVSRSFLPLLRRSRRATIINVGSILGRYGRAGWGPYAVSKFAIEGLTQVLAQELAGQGVRVVSLHPSRIATQLRRQAYEGDEVVPSRNLERLVASVCWLLDHPEAPMSGLSLAANDISAWAITG